MKNELSIEKAVVLKVGELTNRERVFLSIVYNVIADIESPKCSVCGSSELEYVQIECQECGHVDSCNTSGVS